MKKVLSICAAAVLSSAGVWAADTYDIEAAHSGAVFRVGHLGISNTYGMIPDISGTVVFDPEDMAACSVKVVIKPESVNTNNEARDKHLRSPDFFNVKEYPEMTFVSTKWEKRSETRYMVTGDFTLLGETKEITLNVEHVGSGKGMQGDERIGFETIFAIKRGEYGMNYMLDKLGNDVLITVGVEAIKR